MDSELFCLCRLFAASDAHVHGQHGTEGRVETSVFVRAADCAGHHVRAGQTADPERHLRLHHQELPLLQNCRQGMAGTANPQSGTTLMVSCDLVCLFWDDSG